MTFLPIGVVVMISGPGDTSDEVAAVREVISTWNSEHSVTAGVVFVPKHFSTNTVPIYRKGGDGQAVINEQVTNDSDIVVALFKHRLGTPTPRNLQSGTVEEADIKEADGIVHVYFWGGDVPQEVARGDEWKRLEGFREEFHANTRGLYASFDSSADLRQQVERALWEDARSIAALASAGAASVEGAAERKPLDASTAPVKSDVQVSIELEAEVWSAPAVGELIEHMINEDIREEKEWAAKNKRQSFQIDAVTQSILGPGHEPRKPKRASAISDWADTVRARADELHEAIAGAASPPVVVKLNSDKLLERVEVEIVFEGVLGVEPSEADWHELWPALNPPARHPMDFSIPKLQLPARGPLQADWVQDEDDVVLTLKLNELRKRRVPVEIGDTVVLRVPSSESPGSRSFRYTWRASAAGTDEEWSGSGEIPLIDDEVSRQDVGTWLKDQ